MGSLLQYRDGQRLDPHLHGHNVTAGDVAE
jgi:hypothetical protein